MKTFLKNILIFCALALLLFYGLDFIITKGLRKTNSEVNGTFNKVMHGQINADLIINGSSKALVQVSPKILDSILEVDSYNIGMDGSPFLPQNLQFNLYLKHNKHPKRIIQVVSNGFLSKSNELIYYMKFAPYLSINEVAELTKQYDGFSKADYYLPYLKYSGNYGMIINGFANNFGLDLKAYKFYKGYTEKDKSWDNSFNEFVKENPDGVYRKMDSVSVLLFQEYIKTCKNLNIDLILVYPPTYIKSQQYINNKKDIIKFYKEISTNNNIPFLDYSDIELSYSTDYFYNSQHLNKKGAEIFSALLANDLNKYVKKTP